MRLTPRRRRRDARRRLQQPWRSLHKILKIAVSRALTNSALAIRWQQYQSAQGVKARLLAGYKGACAIDASGRRLDIVTSPTGRGFGPTLIATVVGPDHLHGTFDAGSVGHGGF
jgi:hypothetical protein